MIEVVGFIAALLTTFSGVPQIIQTFKYKNTDGLSIKTISLLLAGVVVWFIYGILINNIPLIVSNSICIYVQATLLYLKIKY